MTQCWSLNPADRPKFLEIYANLKEQLLEANREPQATLGNHFHEEDEDNGTAL